MVRPLPNWRSFFAERVALVSTMVVAAVSSRSRGLRQNRFWHSADVEDAPVDVHYWG
jgi:hypothetical protein